jgi:hypothetical protein
MAPIVWVNSSITAKLAVLTASWNPGVRRKKVKSPDPEILFGAGQSPRFGTHF